MQRCDAAVGAFLGAAPGAIPSTAALGGTGARSSGQLREERGGKTHGQLGSSATFHQKSPPSPIPCCPRLDCFIARSRIPLRHRAEPIELPGPRIGLCPWARGIRRPRCEARGGAAGARSPSGRSVCRRPPRPPPSATAPNKDAGMGPAAAGRGRVSGGGRGGAGGCRVLPAPTRAAPQMHFAQTCMAVTMATAARRRRHPNGDGGGGLSGDGGEENGDGVVAL